MTRTLLILALLVAGFAVVFAPAALLRHVVAGAANVRLTALTGTLWNGTAELQLDGQDAGRLAWQLAPVTFLHGALGYHLRLTGPQQALEADLALRPGELDLTLNGTATGVYLNVWLGRYDIRLSGDFEFETVRIEAPYRIAHEGATGAAPGSAQGRLTWTGGPVHYRLSGRAFDATLPPLEANFGDGLAAVVYASGNATPLLHAEVLANGFVRVGMTRLLTRMLNNPWPGGDADHEVVVEVEEQVL